MQSPELSGGACRQLSALFHLPPAVYCLLSPVTCLVSAVCCLLVTVSPSLSAVGCRLSTADRVSLHGAPVAPACCLSCVVCCLLSAAVYALLLTVSPSCLLSRV
jgi:hypothetical protein